jgi:NADH:ubiquinone oxidoreductase subunit 3 (subunit A)
MIADIIFSPLGIFMIFLCITISLYLIGAVISPPFKIDGGKEKMYACGEDLPEKKHVPSAAMFFHIALYFTIMDVAALTVATLPHGVSPYLGIFYMIGISGAVFALILK